MIKTEETKKRCCGGAKKEEAIETTIIVKGNWEHIQEAVDNEFETKIEITRRCQDCRENEETENGKETRKTIAKSGKRIVIHHARWGEAGMNWEQNINMDKEIFKLRETKGTESTYDRIGEICYWGRHYVYKDYLEMCVYYTEKQKNKEENTISTHHIWESTEKGKNCCRRK